MVWGVNPLENWSYPLPPKRSWPHLSVLVVATEKQQRCCGHLGNSPDELRHTRSVAYSVELVLNKHQISGGGAYLDWLLPSRRPETDYRPCHLNAVYFSTVGSNGNLSPCPKPNLLVYVPDLTEWRFERLKAAWVVHTKTAHAHLLVMEEMSSRRTQPHVIPTALPSATIISKPALPHTFYFCIEKDMCRLPTHAIIAFISRYMSTILSTVN